MAKNFSPPNGAQSVISTASRRGGVLVDHVFAQGNVFPLLGDDALAGIVALVDRLAAL